MNIEGKVLNVIFTVVYNLVKVIFKFVDILQAVFRAFAGVGPAKWDNVAINGGNASGNTGELKDTGIVYYLLQSDLVKNMLWSMMLLGIFLVIIFTVMAAIKNVYTSKPKKWQELIGKALLGLANFVVVPIVCMFGVWMGNILLDAVDGATTSGNSILMSRKLFLASAYNANVYRGVEDESEPVDVSIAEEIYIRAYNKKISLSGKSRAELANIVDECYTSAKVNDEGVYEGLLDLDNVAVVEIGYNLSQINYLTLVAGGVFVLWVLISVTYAMIRRIFLILILFIISPVMCAMYPWDDGKALGSWRGQFVPLVLSAYGAVAGMNLFFSVLPVVEKVRLPDTIPGGAFANNIVELIIIVTGLFVMKEFIGTISNLVGGEDALSKGTALRGQTTGAIKKYGGKAGKKAAGVAGAFRKANRAGKAGGPGAFWGSLGGSIGKGLAGGGMNFLKEATGIDSKDFADSWKKGTEEGDKYMENKWKKYNDRRGEKNYRKDNQADIEKLIKDGDYTNDHRVAEELNKIKDPKAREIAADRILRAVNRDKVKNGESATTREKILEKPQKVVDEENRRQSAFGATSGFDAAQKDYDKATLGVADVKASDAATRLGLTDSDFKSDGTIRGVQRVSEGTLEGLKIAAQQPGASSAAISAYADALRQNEVLREWQEALEKQTAKEREYRSSALAFADQLLALAENYKGDTKTIMQHEAQNVKRVANNPSSDVAAIQQAVQDAKDHVDTKVRNVLDTGHE